MLEEFWQWMNREWLGNPEGTITEALDKWQDRSLLAQAIRCESTHFLSSALLGWLVFCLIWIILSETKSEWDEVSIFRCSLLFGLCASITMHILIDGFTNIA